MSNEEVVLKMLVNRLEQLLEANEDLKSKWSAELTEIIHLGKGVIVEAPEPTFIGDSRSARPYCQDLNLDWHMPLTREMIEVLFNMEFPNMPVRFLDRLQDIYDASEPEPEYDDDDDPIDDEPQIGIADLPVAPMPLTAPGATQGFYGVDLGAPEGAEVPVHRDAAWWRAQLLALIDPINAPEMPNEQA